MQAQILRHCVSQGANLDQHADCVLAAPGLHGRLCEGLAEGIGILLGQCRSNCLSRAGIETILQHLISLHNPRLLVPLPGAHAAVSSRRPHFLIIVALRGLGVGKPLAIVIIGFNIKIHWHHPDVLVRVVQTLLGAGAGAITHLREEAALLPLAVVASVCVRLRDDPVNPVVADALWIRCIVVVIAGHVVRVGGVAAGGEGVRNVNIQHLNAVQSEGSIVKSGVPRGLLIWLNRAKRSKRCICFDSS
mmetsp:Transcript_1763/g.3722  ORF Transcript_1763/g.3722 Transcript_1763/m.3722 type:complete len:247 (+) Transcript_1763:422-1162(+)